MELYSENKNYKLYNWNMLDLAQYVMPESIDSIITDPPYELNFMWKWWDNSWIAFNKDTWSKCYDALKPWWYLLAFWGSRTYHRIAVAIEDAGFEIRDTIMRLYGSGFPKSMNIWLAIDKKNWVDNRTWNIKTDWVWSDSGSWCYNLNNWDSNMKSEYEERKATNEWDWWGTALKPSFEPVIVARKPFKWSCTDNVIKYWVGWINIDECRVEYNWWDKPTASWLWKNKENHTSYSLPEPWEKRSANDVWRFPANTILTYWDDDREEVCSWFPNTKSQRTIWKMHDIRNGSFVWSSKQLDKECEMWYNDSGSASRYFYCAKASKKDRDEWLDKFETKTKVFNWQSDKPSEDMKDVEQRFTTQWKNTHPTVKPTELMQYLVRLVTPNWWTVLDPFNWSWSTWKAVMYENKERNKWYKYIWIELTEEYLPIAKARIEYAMTDTTESPNLFSNQ